MKSAFQLFVLLDSVFSASGAFAVEAQWREAMQGYHHSVVEPVLEYAWPELQQLFAQTINASQRLGTASQPKLNALNRRWQAYGFQIAEVESDGRRFWMIRATTLGTSQGVYLLRCDSAAADLILQAPHSFNDQNTGELVLKLFLEGDAKAACWNSISRHAKCRKGCVDVARREDLPFHALTVAFAIANPESRVVQFHGFDPNVRKTEEGRTAAIIISSGTENPTPVVTKLADTLRSALESRSRSVRVFSRDAANSVNELGATKNVQARSLSAIGYRGFVHIEMAPQLRADLVKNSDARAEFLACLRCVP